MRFVTHLDSLDLKYLVKIIKKYDQKFDLYEGDATNPLIDQAEKYMEDNAAPTGMFITT